jgi:hypothetical protein
MDDLAPLRERIANGKYTRWAKDITMEELVGMLWLVGEYGVRAPNQDLQDLYGGERRRAIAHNLLVRFRYEPLPFETVRKRIVTGMREVGEADDLRESVSWFANTMEDRLRTNGGMCAGSSSINHLLSRLQDELEEFFTEIAGHDNLRNWLGLQLTAQVEFGRQKMGEGCDEKGCIRKLADAANYLMMLADAFRDE